MSSINPPDAPGFTQMYTFGVKLIGSGPHPRNEYMVITVRSATEKMAKEHVMSLLRGNYQNWTAAFYTDMDAWKQEANPGEQVKA